MNELYIKVEWPDCQELMDLDGFIENAELSSEGSSVYFVKKEWLDNL
jgi:hypothetical protein